MPGIAKVVVDVTRGRQFDYRLPESLCSDAGIGARVIVPFGKREVTGTIMALSDVSTHARLRDVIRLADAKPLLDEVLLKLARWMSEYYCTPLEQVLRTMVPRPVRRKGARFRTQLKVSLVQETAVIDRELPRKQAAVVELLHEHGDMLLSELTRRAHSTAAPVRALERKGRVLVRDATVDRSPVTRRRVLPTAPLQLTPHQATALEQIVTASKAAVSAPAGKMRGNVVLLHGVTGSGKTEVYLQAISHLLETGRGAIVLVPEISLTPQTVERFQARFGERIAVLHSHLSDGERHDEWHRIHEGNAHIVVGARSAVFAPVRDLGLIVVDEEHEPSYKQEDAPRYSARDVAVMRGCMEGCAVVLGSATPALESWHNARRGKYELASLPVRVDDRRMPAMRVVDMRIEAERTGHVSVLSGELVEAIRKRLDAAEQTILFLNRRGYATSLVCPHCGFVATCDHCSVSFTYHRKSERLCCHICGDSRVVPARCPSCSDPAFKFTGVGTQRVERIIAKCFPSANVQRMDADMTTKKDAYERILGDFRAGKTDILIGTQMIAKGLHFPNVTLVGVIYADLSLHMPDFRAAERTFQLLAQVSGRAGRGDVSGEVIVQTYTPHNVAVQAARRLDYEGFSDQELEFRKELSYPPFSHLVCLTLRGRSDEKTSFFAASLARELAAGLPRDVIVSEAAPAPLARAKGLYRYQVMLRSIAVQEMTGPLHKVLADFTLEEGLKLSVDVDAVSLM